MRDDLQQLRDKTVELELKLDRVSGQQGPGTAHMCDCVLHEGCRVLQQYRLACTHLGISPAGLRACSTMFFGTRHACSVAAAVGGCSPQFHVFIPRHFTYQLVVVFLVVCAGGE